MAVKPKPLLGLLEEIASQMGIDVAYDEVMGRGGLCRVQGRQCFIINRGLTTDERIAVLIEGLRTLPLEGVYLPPVVRERIEEKRRDGEPEKR